MRTQDIAAPRFTILHGQAKDSPTDGVQRNCSRNSSSYADSLTGIPRVMHQARNQSARCRIPSSDISALNEKSPDIHRPFQTNMADPATRTIFFDADFDEFVESLLQKHHVPGISICIVEADKISSRVCLFTNRGHIG